MDNEKREFDYEFESETEKDILEDASTDNIEEDISSVDVPLESDEQPQPEEACVCDGEPADDNFEEVSEVAFGDSEDAIEFTEEEITEPSKNNKPLYAILGVIGALVVAVIIYCICYINSVGLTSAVNTLPPDEVSQEGEIVKAEKLNIKFENPFITMFEGKAGTTVSAVKTGDYALTADVFRYFLTNEALNYEYKLYQSKKISDLNSFDWNEIDKNSGLTHTEIVKIKAVRTILPIISVISEAQKRGITLSEEETKEVTSFIEQVKTSYGDKLEETLKKSGYEDIKQLESVQKFQKIYEKAFNAFYDDPVSYVKHFENVEDVLTDDKVTVKHILIQFPEGITNASEDTEKAETLKKADDVLAKAKSGEDFDKLIEEYNQDPGQGKNGYTFSNDGTMVQDFADASFKLEIGQISELVETPYGYHIIKRIERIADFAEYTELLTKNSKIKVNRKIYSETPVNVNLAEILGETSTQK